MYFNDQSPSAAMGILCGRRPDAVAVLQGSEQYPTINGTAELYQTGAGVYIVTAVTGLPRGECNIFAMHIHAGDACTGNETDPFAGAGSHYNPGETEHPCHAGDLSPLFGTRRGTAWGGILTDRFQVWEVVGRTVIIHRHLDDFTTQPAGNAGEKIACGVIQRVRRS